MEGCLQVIILKGVNRVSKFGLVIVTVNDFSLEVG